MAIVENHGTRGYRSHRQTRPTNARAVAWANAQVIDWMRAQLAASGGDPATIADEPFAYWRLPEVERRVGVAKSTLYRWVSCGQFPTPIRLGGAL
jgi:predicted DNA-binding transcriptional regulator AlpA